MLISCYSILTNQFTSLDPASIYSPQSFLLDPQQLHTYAYARNNPVRWNDPTGMVSSSKLFSGAMLFVIATGLTTSTYGAISSDEKYIEIGFHLQEIGVAGGALYTSAQLDKDFYNKTTNQKAPNTTAVEFMADYASKQRSLAAVKITNGHAYEKHKDELGVNNKKDFAMLISETMRTSTIRKELMDGQVLYGNIKTNVILIVDPSTKDGGTIYAPVDGVRANVKEIMKQQESRTKKK